MPPIGPKGISLSRAKPRGLRDSFTVFTRPRKTEKRAGKQRFMMKNRSKKSGRKASKSRVFDSMTAASAALNIPFDELKDLKAGGSDAFSGSRVRGDGVLSELATKRLHSAVDGLCLATGVLRRVLIDCGGQVPNWARLDELVSGRLDEALGQLLELSKFEE